MGRDSGKTQRDAASIDLAMRDLLHLFIVLLLVFAYFSILTSALGDGDTSWHLAAGKWIVEHGTVPTVDPFSYTFRGKLWTAHEWLSEVLMFAAYSAGGWAGLLLMFGLVTGATFVTLAVYVRRWLAFPMALVPIAFCFGGTVSYMLARPHLFGWLLLALWITSLLRAREAGRTPPVWTILLMVCWANMHGSFVLGLALIGPFALEALIEADKPKRGITFVRWAGFGLVALLAALITPQGIEGLTFPIYVSTMAALKDIDEWKPTSFATFGQFELILISTIFICLHKGIKMPIIRLLLMLALLHMAFAHVRHQAVFLIISCLLFARPAAEALGVSKRNGERELRLSVLRLREIGPVIAVMTALVGGVALASITFGNQRPDNYRLPQNAINHVPIRLRNLPVFNEYSFGGPLIFNGIPVFIDGRADVYGDEFFADYVKIAKGDFGKWEAIKEKWHIEWVIMPPDNLLVSYLDRQPDWVRTYTDKWAVIHVRKLDGAASASKKTKLN
ncbi:hypothetical protein [Aquisediminimonas profunda]|uniref:hypothetical protein n=1 Tax=Aquisediminimonas profunda TaxID=1550733 RepID=UPI001C625C1E|nr:hypothetical protein [Aquisediminimonas profunda]